MQSARVASLLKPNFIILCRLGHGSLLKVQVGKSANNCKYEDEDAQLLLPSVSTLFRLGMRLTDLMF